MSDDASERPSDEAAGQPLGPWLREARERLDLSVEAVAAALHLDPGIVSALESDRFERLGAPVFVKGHVRALAAHLGLDTDEAVRRYEATAGDAALQPPDLIVQYQRPLRRGRLAPLLALGAVVLIIVLLLVFFGPGSGSRGDRGAPAAGAAAESDPAIPATVAAPESDAEPDAVEAGDASPTDDFAARLATARARSAAAEVRAPAAAPVSPAAAAPDRDDSGDSGDTPLRADAAPAGEGLTLRFSDTCWYEVRDAADRRLATGTASAGDVRRVDGPRPLTVVVGVADAVNLSLDGERVEIPASARRGRSARLTLP